MGLSASILLYPDFSQADAPPSGDNLSIRDYDKKGIEKFLEYMENGLTFCMCEVVLKKPKSEVKEILDGLRFFHLIVSDNGLYRPISNNVEKWKKYGWDWMVLDKAEKAKEKMNYDLGLDDD